MLQIKGNRQHPNLNLLQIEVHLLQVKVATLQINFSAPSTILPHSLPEDRMLQIMVNLQRGEVVLLQMEGLMLQVEDSR